MRTDSFFSLPFILPCQPIRPLLAVLLMACMNQAACATIQANPPAEATPPAGNEQARIPIPLRTQQTNTDTLVAPPVDRSTAFPGQPANMLPGRSEQQSPVQQPVPLSVQPEQQTQTQQPNRFPGQSQSSPQQQPPRQDNSPSAGVTRITQKLDKLPNSAGQIWREYNISPYTSQITATEQPQKAILDWILRETGKAMWFNEPLGVLNIDKNHLYVYHTPEIHAVVKTIVDRFVRTRAQLQSVNINLLTVDSPNWRSSAYPMLQSIDVQSPSVEAWLISKENAAHLLGQLGRRADFKQHAGGKLTNHDGQPFVLEKHRQTQFVRRLRWVPNQTPNHQPLLTSINEGYKLEISSLSAITNDSIEAVIKCDVKLIEKLNTVRVNVPGVGVTAPGVNGAVQQMHLQIPALISWEIHERFKWPNDQVLLLSCGVVATLDPETRTEGFKIPGIARKTKRSEALLFIEYRGPAAGASVPQTARNQLPPIQSAPARPRQ